MNRKDPVRMKMFARCMSTVALSPIVFFGDVRKAH
jgi:hypothetical protein